MTKNKNEWKILFDSISEKYFLITALVTNGFMVVFTMFALALQLAKTGNSKMIFNSGVFIIFVLMSFIGFFFNRSSYKFSKTLPSTKKIYTRNMSIIFELLNSISLVSWIVLWIIFSAIGKDVQLFAFVFFIYCLIFLVISVLMPFTAKAYVTEPKPTLKHISKKYLKIIKIIIEEAFYFLLFLSISEFFNKIIQSIDLQFFSVNILFFIICGLIILLSCYLNRLVWKNVYKSA